jgi:hypothetical protein
MMIEKWRNMPAGERLRFQLLVAFCLVGVYGLAIYPTSKDKYDRSVMLLNRIKNRAEIQTTVDEMDSGGLSARALENRIEKVGEQLKEVSETLAKLESGFAPVDSADKQQKLMLEISTLAERYGIKLLSISRKRSSPKGQMTTKIPVDPVSGRPFLDVKARAEYGRLLNFLNELKDLSFHVSVMNLKLHDQDPSGDHRTEADVPSNELYVYLVLSI